jgi:hypothetical protein
MGVLAVARSLTPSEAGVGTHTQLGLEPCIMLSSMGIPCPMCGMTTTFSLMSHYRPVDAFLNQPFGVVLFLLTVLIAVYGLLEMMNPRRRWLKLYQWIANKDISVLVAFFLGFMGSWLYKIAWMQKMFTWVP